MLLCIGTLLVGILVTIAIITGAIYFLNNQSQIVNRDDVSVKNWGTQNEKETETGDVVVQKKIDEDEPESEDNVEYDLKRNVF